MLLALLVACADPAPTWHQDVQPVVAAYCGDCHSDGGIAPFPLQTRDDVLAIAPLVEEAVDARVMPPFYAERGHTALRYDTALSDAERDLLLAWLRSPAPLGDPGAPGDPITVERPGLDRFDVALAPDAPYAPTARPDEYRCFVLDWPETEDRYVTGHEVIPGNREIVHHAAVYAIPPDQVGKLDTFEAMDEGPGYSCYGSAAQTDWEPAGLTDQFVQIYLGAWTPGVTGLGFDNGQRVVPGSKIVLQVHYFTQGSTDATDLTTVRLRLADSVAQESWYMPWLNVLWPLGGSMIIPPETTMTHRHEAEPVGSINLTVFAGDADLSDGMLLHSVYAHMHLLGRSFRYTLKRADGTEQVLLSVPNYDFHWQQEYVFETPVDVLPGDRLQVACTFDNTAAWRTPRGLGPPVEVDWGEGSLDEMCVAHTRITARAGG